MQQRMLAVATVVFAVTLIGCDRTPEPDAPPPQAEQEDADRVEDDASEPTADAEAQASEEQPEATVRPDEPNSVPETLKQPKYSQISSEGTIQHRPSSVPDAVAAELERRQEAGTNRLEFDPDQWSDSYGKLDALEVLTTDEPVRVQFGEFRRIYQQVGSQPILETEPSEALKNAGLGATFYAASGVFSRQSRINEGLDSEPVDEQLAQQVWKRAIGELRDHEIELIEEYFEQVDDSLDDPDFDAYFKQHRANFSTHHSRLITLNVHIGDRAGYDDEHNCFGAGYLADDAGNNIREAVFPHLEFHCFDPDLFVDLDGDGTWGVTYTRGVLPHPVDLDMVEFDDDGEPTIRGLQTWD